MLFLLTKPHASLSKERVLVFLAIGPSAENQIVEIQLNSTLAILYSLFDIVLAFLHFVFLP
jgi:hypothetical protein